MKCEAAETKFKNEREPKPRNSNPEQRARAAPGNPFDGYVGNGQDEQRAGKNANLSRGKIIPHPWCKHCYPPEAVQDFDAHQKQPQSESPKPQLTCLLVHDDFSFLQQHCQHIAAEECPIGVLLRTHFGPNKFIFPWSKARASVIPVTATLGEPRHTDLEEPIRGIGDDDPGKEGGPP